MGHHIHMSHLLGFITNDDQYYILNNIIMINILYICNFHHIIYKFDYFFNNKTIDKCIYHSEVVFHNCYQDYISYNLLMINIINIFDNNHIIDIVFDFKPNNKIYHKHIHDYLIQNVNYYHTYYNY